MEKRDRPAYALAIVGVGAALVVLIVGASTIAALGHAVPKELWAIGGALSGALVGILVPAPRLAASREATPSAAGYGTHNAAVSAARLKTEEIKRSPEVTDNEVTAAEGALRKIEACRDQLKVQRWRLSSIATSWSETGGGHDAAAAAVGLQQSALTQAKRAAAEGASGDKGLAAAVTVHEAAHEAAAKAVPRASQRSAGWLGAVKTIFTEAKILVPLILFTVALTLGVLLSLGVIHAVVCPHGGFVGHGSALKEIEKQGCYYATTTKQAANALIALASAAGGALLGVFAISPGDTTETSKTG
ncbi:MAG: hypothetical protein WB709_11275 [Solirubrobacteraceae bacterium]